MEVPNSIIKTSHMNLIIDRIYEGRCVPFLGAAVNVSDKNRDYAGLPLGVDVAKEFIKEIDFKGRDDRDLARITLQFEFETDRPQLITRLKTILPDQNCNPSPLLRTLANLPLKLIVTTNYDRLMECALKNKDFKIIVQPHEGFENKPEIQQQFKELALYKGLILYKIHGTFSGNREPKNSQAQEDQSTVVITEDDYIKFLTLIDKQEERIGVPKIISSRFTYSTLLFLGYSLEDWDFRTIYKGLIETLPQNQSRKSFAIQKDPSEFWINFWQKKGVEIYNIDLYDFADQLDKNYKSKFGEN